MSHSFAPPRILHRRLLLVSSLACLLFVGWLAGVGSAWAQFGVGESKQVTPALVADTTAIAPGKPFTAGVRLRMLPGWHVYYQFSGDSGAPPRIEWQLPEGFKVGPIQWPIPGAHIDEGDMLAYMYENDVLLMVEITPPATLPPGDVTLKAHVDWLVCEKICVPGQGEVELKLPVGEAAPANAELFTQWRAQLAKTTNPPFQVKWDRSKPTEFSLRLEGVPKDVKAEFFPLPPKEAKPAHPKTSEIAGDGTRTITFPIEEGGAPNLPWRGVLATGKGEAPREGWLIEADPHAAATASGPTAMPSTTTPPSLAVTAPAADGGLLWKLGVAFLGGLIMNVMPCVLPVITLKIFGFVNQAGEDPRRVFRLGLAFNAGVFAFFLGIAALMANLRGAFNWGYQFQNPYLLAGMIALVFVLGLSLLGVFDIALTGGAASAMSELSSREGYGGAFMHGLFTTLLGTSCTAPFLGASLSFAVTQSAPVIFLIFTCIAAGMCFPYFLLTVQPAWLRYLPKPGLWMERAKQIMGFAMLAVAAWLLGVLARRGQDAVSAMSWFLLVLGFSSWLFGLANSWMKRVAVLVLPIAGYWLLIHGNLNTSTAVATTGLEQRIAAARAEGLPVFIDFTADWCPNCKVYERTVLKSDVIQEKFREKKVVFFVADWTNTDDPEITRLLKSHVKLPAVPLYVLYRPGEAEPVVHDALTRGLLLEELDKIKN